MSERSGADKQSEQCGASERVSGASERANGRASDPVLQSVFLFILAHSAVWASGKEGERGNGGWEVDGVEVGKGG